MKAHQTKTKVRQALILSITLLFSLSLFAQEKTNKLSASAALGLPVTFFGIPSKPIGIFTAAARYSINKTWSAEFKLTAGTFYNNATGNPPKTVLNNSVTDIAAYRTPVYGFNAIGYYNLHNFLGLNKHPDSRWLPYINAGIGINLYKPSKTLVNGVSTRSASFGKPFRDYQFGIGTRYYVNTNMDFFGGAEYHISETYYLDAIKEKTGASLDQYLNFYGGVSIKIGGKPWNNLADWSHKNIENPNESKKLYSHWAMDLTLGTPILFTPVGHNITGMFGIGARYTFTNSLGVQLNYAMGTVSGDHVGSATAKRNSPEAINSFKTNLNHYTVRAFLNVLNLTGEPNARRNWNHFAIVGAGLLAATGDATFANGKTVTDKRLYSTKSAGIQNIVIGYEARKYLKHNLDFIAGADFSYNQTKYLDQAGRKPTLNSHLYIHAGVTYKIGTSKDKEHIDWAYQNYNNYMDKSKTIEQVPVIEKPISAEPKIDTSAVVSTPVEPAKPVEPVVPVVVEPTTPVVEPKPVPEPVKVEPKPAVAAPEVVPTPKTVKPQTEPTVKQKPYVATEEVVPPPSTYNVIVACYSVNKLNIARANQNRLAKKGYNPSIYRSSTQSRLLRMSVISTDDKAEALKVLRKARREIDPESWLYIYNKQ